MKKTLYIIIPTFLLILLPKTSLAAGLTFEYGNKTFNADSGALATWQSTVTFSTTNPLTGRAATSDYYIASFLGKPVPTERTQTFSYRPAAVYDFVKTFAQNLNHEAEEPELTIEGNRATKFVPPQNGVLVDPFTTTMNALQALSQNATSVAVSASITKPKKSLAETNNLGIKELIGHGASSFKGSPKNRRFNIKVGVGKVSGIVVPQGAEFSFNENLGPVEKETGFLPELVIKASGTVPEFGGGLCQVSSTTFRAAMDAGLPITQRRNHSYAVQYYAPQGTDATIYPGVIDLKFINDTPGAILIWPYFDGTDGLVYDIYGSYDGRKVQLEKPVVYDRKSDGSMKATWTRLVTTAAGVERKDVFNSTYLPPALFHKTETFPSATSTTAATPAATVQTN